jgi:subtilisin family serine protease
MAVVACCLAMTAGLRPLAGLPPALAAPASTATEVAVPTTTPPRDVGIVGQPIDGHIRVVVRLTDQALSPADRPNSKAPDETAAKVLRDHAERTQGPLRQRVQELFDQGLVSSYTPLWVFNGMIVTVDPEAVERLEAIPGVDEVVPDRPIFLAQGHGFGPPEPEITLTGAPDVWSAGYTGQGAVVAVLDTGVDVTHPDLASRFRGGNNSWFDPYGENPTVPVDVDGHGTEVASLIVGGDTGGTTIGMAPDATFIAAKVFSNAGAGTFARVHEALQWVLDPDGDPLTDDAPDVVNNSWTFLSTGCDLEFELDLLALRLDGILPVFAAGNAGPSAGTSTSPGNNPSALSVGSLNQAGTIDTGSSRGPNACSPSETFPDLTAPGVGVRTAAAGGGYTTATGTSFAAPYVSGAAALLLSAEPTAALDDLETAIIAGAVDMGQPGPDNDYGAGRLDVAASLDVLPAGQRLVLSFVGASTTLPDVGVVNDEDLVALNEATGGFELVFDGSDVGLGSANIDAVAVVDADTLLLSFRAGTTVPGIPGTVDDSDIVQFDATSLGPETAGTFSPFFDGSLVGLTASGEDVDAIDLLADGSLLISTLGAPSVPGVNGDQDEDLLRFVPTVPGDYSSGTWSMYFDGSDLSLGGSGEDTDGAFLDGDDVVLTTVGSFSVTGLSGGDEDIFACVDLVSGSASSCAGFVSRVDGSAAGVPGGADVNALGFVAGDLPEPLPELTVTDVTELEGDAGTTAFEFQVALSDDPPAPVSVQVDTGDDTADGSDYTPVVARTLTWNPGGALTQTVTVQVTGDTDGEPDETLFLDLSDPTGARVADGRGVGTILDDDQPRASIDDVADDEGDAGTTPLVFTVTLDRNPTAPVSVQVDTMDGLATAPTDYTPVSTVLTFLPGGSLSQTVTVDVNGDGDAEGNETFTVELSSPIGLTVDDGMGIGTILNDDQADEIFASFTGNVNLGGGLTVADEDIAGIDTTTGAARMVFDGSDVGLPGGADINAFAFLDADSLVISFENRVTLPGLGEVDDSDLVRFDATALGPDTQGSFTSLFVDGSLIELTSNNEEIDAVEVLADGTLIISTIGNPSVTGVSGDDDADLLSFTPTVAGDYSAGTWAMWYDASDVGHNAGNGNEDVDAVFVADGDPFVSTVGNFVLSGGLSGGDEDVVRCSGFVPGSATSCGGGLALDLDGSAFGWPGAADIDAMSR